MTTNSFLNSQAFFLPDFLSSSALEIGGSCLYFDRIGFDIPVFIQQEVISHFNEVGLASKKADHALETILGLTAYFFKDMQSNTSKAIEQLKPLFESKYFMGIGTIHFIMRGGREFLVNKTKDLLPSLKPQLVNPHLLHIGARELVWHIHELYLELEGDIPQIIEYLKTDINKYQDPYIYIGSYIFHRLPALQDNPEHVLINNPLMINALACIGVDSTLEKDQGLFVTKKEYLAFTFFDAIIGPFLPKIDVKIAEQIVELRTKRNNELLELRKHIRDMVTKLLNDSNESTIGANDIEDCLHSLQNSVNDVLKINQKAWKSYFQSLLESKPIWLGIAGLISSIASGHFPLISASLGAEIIATMGTNAAKTIRNRNEILSVNPTRFIYYLDHKLREK